MPLRRILRFAPWPLRRRMLAGAQKRLLPRVAPERRLRTARLLVPLGAGPRPGLGADAAIIAVRTAHGRMPARRAAQVTPAGVRRDNLDRVVSALDTAGIDWFRVPVESLTGTALAVRESDRDRTVSVLEALTASDAGRLEIVLPRRSRQPRRARRAAKVLRASWPVTDRRGGLVFGTEFGCEIEFWRKEGRKEGQEEAQEEGQEEAQEEAREDDGTLIGPRSNPVADVVPAGEPAVFAPEHVFGPFCGPGETVHYRTRDVFTMVSPDRVSFPIDVVYTWVDGNDPAWRERKARALRENGWVAEVSDQSANESRFVSRDELCYSMRSLHAFAPWVRHVFLVTDGQVPAWLDTSHPRITVVPHREIFGDTGRLPTFNSQAIESRLHRIPGLAEHFLYLNDDVFLGRPVAPEMFFTPGGLTRFFPSTALVDSAPRLPSDPPANSAGKNNRRLIQEAFGRVLTRKMKHTPHPSRRSVLAEIELRFAEHVEATAAHQFRHPDDISLLSSLQQYYAYLTGRAAPGEIRYMYTDLADPSTPFRLSRLLHDRHLDAFCLNDTDSDPAAADEQAALLADFLPAYLPFPSPFELPTPRAGTTSLALAPAPVVARQVARAPADPIHPDIALPSQPSHLFEGEIS